MKRYVSITLKVLLIGILSYSALRLASLGAGLLSDNSRFEEMRAELSDVPEASGAVAAQTDAAPDTGAEVVPQGTVSGTISSDGPFYDNMAEPVGQTSESEVKVTVRRNAERFSSFTKRNPDFAGWLAIDGTKIDYPVMYSPKEPDFYLTHDFDRKESASGVPYIGKSCSLSCDNIILYAHNMKNGTMFAGLLKYADESFCREHPVIRFDTTEEDGIYDIIAVFREKVHYQDEVGVFRYYNYCGELSRSQFDEYVAQIKAISLYDTQKTASYGQKLLTLSTCSYHTENGRFVVVAVKR